MKTFMTGIMADNPIDPALSRKQILTRTFREAGSHPAALWLVGTLHAAFGLTLSLSLYWKLHMHTLDIGLYDQIVWNTANGRWFEYSLAPVRNFLGGHFSPVLLLFALLLKDGTTPGSPPPKPTTAIH